MASVNRVFLMGNLTRDPEVRYLQSGKAVADLGLAVNRKYKTSSGEDREEVLFVDVVVWERQAETAAQYLKKGSSVFVEGSLQLDTWESNNEKRSKIKVRADNVQFMDRKRAEHGDAPDNVEDDRVSKSAREKSSRSESVSENDADGASENDDLPF